MQLLSYSMLVASVLGVATASNVHTASESHLIYKRSSCEARNVFFHFNDSSIGTTPSCSWNVINLGALPISQDNFPRTLSTRQTPNCTDGPVTNYTVVSGDTLEKIAATYDSGVCDIAAASDLDNPNFIEVGQVLAVPTDVCDPDNESCITPPGSRPCVPEEEGVDPVYEIQAGNTFFIIGQEFNITVDAIRAANPCVDPSTLEVGQEINIPICPDCSSTCSE
ncbi:intracellular hyphae protein 1 [Diaporthe amygdali]|uniref:intracellular hyphae protein 1 n=1 Tax=Phomopsis amygdali TaxID=1214568 RepID=UPI0022FED86D|nr:intracellular hyphae protein 1 [Diaporthe amygdali]KAJ0119573.1 intracellular hyphae protein 1 [Diaporthe amygdali]